MLYRIESPRFVAGIITDAMGKVTKAAPILRWAIGQDISKIAEQCRMRRWEMRAIERPNTNMLRETGLMATRVDR